MSTISSVNATMPRVMSGASSRMSPNQKMTNLFQQIDANNSGSITPAQFTQAFQNLNPPVAFKNMGHEAILSKLDPNGSNSISKQDFVAGMTKLMEQARNQAANGAAAPSPVQTISDSRASFDAILGNFINTHV